MIEYYEDNTKVVDSYKLSDNDIIMTACKIITERRNRKLLVTRTLDSYINEIIAHKRLYKIGLFRSHTKDTDLEEEVNELLEFLYSIIAL